ADGARRTGQSDGLLNGRHVASLKLGQTPGDGRSHVRQALNFKDSPFSAGTGPKGVCHPRERRISPRMGNDIHEQAVSVKRHLRPFATETGNLQSWRRGQGAPDFTRPVPPRTAEKAPAVSGPPRVLIFAQSIAGFSISQ